MKQAIVTGATGFIGSRLVRMLLGCGTEVIALGRKNWTEIDPKRLKVHKKLTYLKIDMKEISSLHSIQEQGIKVHESAVFYHFAWWGESGLSDLNVKAQLENIDWTIEAFKVAAQIGCRKFIHVGTMEEAFVDKYLKLDHLKNNEYNRHVVYSVAKKYAREMLKAISANYNLELILATNSHVMGPNDDKDSFLQKTLQKLMNQERLEFTSGEQIFDVISVKDCARAYKLIGEKGVVNTEYWIGSGKPCQLREYVEIMAKLYPSNQNLEFGKVNYNDVMLERKLFSTEALENDTGFRCIQSYQDAVHELYFWLSEGVLNE